MGTFIVDLVLQILSWMTEEKANSSGNGSVKEWKAKELRAVEACKKPGLKRPVFINWSKRSKKKQVTLYNRRNSFSFIRAISIV